MSIDNQFKKKLNIISNIHKLLALLLRGLSSVQPIVVNKIWDSECFCTGLLKEISWNVNLYNNLQLLTQCHIFEKESQSTSWCHDEY